MLDTREIHSLTDFPRNHKAHLARLKKTHGPEVLTVNGKAELVVQDAASYQIMLDRLHHMETIAAIQEGMASAERGELTPAAQNTPADFEIRSRQHFPVFGQYGFRNVKCRRLCYRHQEHGARNHPRLRLFARAALIS